jgi:heptose-I-phosphate ethanolaminephosphotransferase
MRFLKKYKFEILLFIVIHLFLTVFYWLTSPGIPPKTLYLQMRRFIPCALAFAIAVHLWRASGYRLRDLTPHFLVFILWVVVFNTCSWLTFHLSDSLMDSHYDIVFGAYIFAVLVCLRLLFLRDVNAVQRSFDKYLFGLFDTILLVIPIFQIGYYLYYKTPVSTAACMALLQTNQAEAREYLLLNVGYTGLLSVALFFVVLFLILSHLNQVHVIPGAARSNPSNKVILVAAVICLATGFYSSKIFNETGVMGSYVEAKTYFAVSREFTQFHEGNYASLTVSPTQPKFSKPSTIVMVIGESAGRNFLSAYGGAAVDHNDNTPWLRQNSTADPAHFLLFKHAYTSWPQTVPSLERALTEKNQYNSKEFNNSITIIDIAKKAGYTTYWFSGQGKMGDADTAITLVAKTADHSFWLRDSLANAKNLKYDGDLLEYLKQVDPTKNNFIVLHLMGSHENYISRYPESFTKFGKPGEFNMPLNYDNSLAYSDWILGQIYKYGKEHLNLQAMLYFSDHGGDPYRKRHPDRVPFIALRIPMFIYLSDAYKETYPTAYAALTSHTDSYFTNDLMYEVICGMLGVTSSHYDETNSLASPKYKFTRETLTTNLGKTKLTADTDESLMRESERK